MNSVNLSGRTGNIPVLRKTQTGKSVCNFDLAVYVTSEITAWVPIVAWEVSAEIASKAEKGDLLEISGHMNTRYYDNSDGKSIKVVEVVASRIVNHSASFEKRYLNEQSKPTQTTTKSYQKTTPVYEEPEDEGPVLNISSDDLPF